MTSGAILKSLYAAILLCFVISFDVSYGNGNAVCPWACSCSNGFVDCSHRGLYQVPKHMPPEAERIDLQGNNITIIFQSDFQLNKKLKILQLTDNQIHTIERDAFVELISLERLKLNNNKLRDLPEVLFYKLKNLQRLDLSHNELTALGKRALRGLTSLRGLNLDHNRLKCIDEKLLDQFKSLEILTLNNNNLTYMMLDAATASKLRTLRLSENPIVCDCRLARLAAALKTSVAGRTVGARCQAPVTLKGTLITDVALQDFVCTGPTAATPGECSAEPRCPVPCRCTPEGTIDCREKVLSRIPQGLPDHATEIRLEQNEISEVGNKAFSAQKRVLRIDLSNNKITKIAADAFSGLKSLTSLVLYGNKIKELPSGIFHGLSSLQLLLLNSNEITCVRKDTFRDLQALTLLSLYDNNIQTIPNGTFDSLTGIQTLHLARNPFVCDCGLRWLATYLRKNPIETSGAKCDSPKRLARKRIDSLRDDSFKCKAGETSALSTSCGLEEVVEMSPIAAAWCPAGCVCDSTARVHCSGAQMTELPKELPLKTSQLLFADNHLSSIRSDGLFGRLPELSKLDLSRNMIASIEDNAFDGAASVLELILDGNQLISVTDKMFQGLHSLTILSLSDNKITCITPGAFDHLTTLTTLKLGGNPLVCNCHLSWLGGWLQSRGLTTSATCATPDSVAGSAIEGLTLRAFRCDVSDKGCLSADYCPKNCTCTGTVVRCPRAGLTEIPPNMPRQTTELYLESNSISELRAEQLAHLSQLTRLDLSNNNITVLANNTFAGLSRLSTLIVSYNRLRCVQRDALKGLTQLRILSLHGNDLSMIPEGVFRDLDSITHVALGSNPLYCDCALRWLSEWVKRDFVEPGIAKCAEPFYMKEKLLLSTPVGAFACKGNPPSEILSKCDACYTRPCSNDGECRATHAGGYECMCARGYHGAQCELTIDACYGSPCANNAICTVLEEGRFNCTCQPGFTGMRCEVNIDDCVAHKCENNATCVDQLNEYKCQCADGFMGQYCEKKIPYCTAEFNPCHNGAQCVDHFSHYTCNCPKGYSGQNCTINADDCVDHMCQNGATCVDGLDEYKCVCAAGYAGRYCEAAPHAALGTSPCAHHDCLHGVCYLPSPTLHDDIMVAESPLMSSIGTANNDYLCKCAPGYSGRLCEYLTSLTFNHNISLVELEPLPTRPEANVTIIFSTTQHHGVLIYFGGGQEHLAVELFNGRIRISYDVGNHPTSTMYSFEMVSDGSYHKAELIAIKKNFTLRVDGAPARSIINDGSKDYLRLDRPLFIGGVPGEVGREAFSRWHLRNITSFKGCLKGVWINHKQVDFTNAARMERTSPGCGGDDVSAAQPAATMLEDAHAIGPAQDPCVPNPCKRGGRCIAEEGSTSDYTCRCRPGTRGAQCELRASIAGSMVAQPNKAQQQKAKPGAVPQTNPTHILKQSPPSSTPESDSDGGVSTGCRKEATREFVWEGGCRSRRAVRNARCVGPCTARHSCCVPKAVKKRKVRLMCADGTRFSKEIDIVRKCACSRKCQRNIPGFLSN